MRKGVQSLKYRASQPKNLDINFVVVPRPLWPQMVSSHFEREKIDQKNVKPNIVSIIFTQNIFFSSQKYRRKQELKILVKPISISSAPSIFYYFFIQCGLNPLKKLLSVAACQ